MWWSFCLNFGSTPSKNIKVGLKCHTSCDSLKNKYRGGRRKTCGYFTPNKKCLLAWQKSACPQQMWAPNVYVYVACLLKVAGKWQQVAFRQDRFILLSTVGQNLSAAFFFFLRQNSLVSTVNFLTAGHKMSPSSLPFKSILSICAPEASSFHVTLVCWISKIISGGKKENKLKSVFQWARRNFAFTYAFSTKCENSLIASDACIVCVSTLITTQRTGRKTHLWLFHLNSCTDF